MAWPGTIEIERGGVHLLEKHAGIWCIPGSPYASTVGALAATRYARESGVPFLGTCGGFQHALIEFARNVAGLVEADHEETNETNPDAGMKVVRRLSCAPVEVTRVVTVRRGTVAFSCVESERLEEGFRCSFGLNPQHRRALVEAGMVFSGEDEDGDVRIAELAEHPFFLATLFQPERAALEGRVHGFIQAFFDAARPK